MKYHRKTSRENSSENKGNVLYISNLPIKVSESQIKEKFSKFGKIEEINIVREPFSKVSRGFAFVTFEDPKSGQEAIKALDKTTMEDKTINVEESKRARPHKPTPGVYLGPKSNEYNRRRFDKREFNYHGRRSRSNRNRSFSRRSHRNSSRSRSRNRRNSRSRSREMRNSRSRSREIMNRNTGRRYY
jgi:RNA recognition motif-containing protein